MAKLMFKPSLCALAVFTCVGAPNAVRAAHAAPGAQAQTEPSASGAASGDAFVDELKDMTFIGFEETDSAVRVFVRTSDPVKYTVDTSHPTRIVLVLDNCRVPIFNNTRPLDTQYFDGPVSWIEAKSVESPSASVHVEIHLRHKAVMRPLQKDTFLALEFEK